MVLVGDARLTPDEIRRVRDFEETGATIIAWQHSSIVQDRFRVPPSRAPSKAPESEATPSRKGSAPNRTSMSMRPLFGGSRSSVATGFAMDPWCLWWAELYLYHETPLRLAVRDVEVAARLVTLLRPGRLVVVRPVRALEAAAKKLVREVDVIGDTVEGPPFWFRTTRLHAADLLKLMGTGLKSLLRRRRSQERAQVFFLTHGSMWRGDREMYFDRILPAVEEKVSTTVVAFGPPVPFRKRRPGSWLRDLLEIGEKAVLATDQPDIVVLYAESSGLGRAAVTAARVHGIPSFAVQHGIMYEQYYSHEHASFEVGVDGVPLPTKTAVFGSVAKDLLVRRGSYDPDRIVITGSPKFDDLVQAAQGFDASATKKDLGVPEGARLLVLASRWTAGSPVFRELVEAVERVNSSEDLWLFVKPHQAESRKPYDEVLDELHPVKSRVLSTSMNLLELLFASDGLVTVDSFASAEALVLGRSVLVVELAQQSGRAGGAWRRPRRFPRGAERSGDSKAPLRRGSRSRAREDAEGVHTRVRFRCRWPLDRADC